MKNIRRILSAGALALACVGVAAAGTIVETASFGPNNTDFSWTLNVPQATIPVGQTLTGITLSINGSAASSPFELVNNANINENFGLSFTSFINILGNSASSDGVGGFIGMTLFNSGGPTVNPSQTINLGPNPPGGVCPTNTPSNACNTVFFSPVTGSGSVGPLSIASVNWANYLGGGFVTLNGNTNSTTVFNGGGGNINLIQTTAAAVNATITYTYQETPPPGTPEPATMALMGSALVGLGLLRKRIKS